MTEGKALQETIGTQSRQSPESIFATIELEDEKPENTFDLESRPEGRKQYERMGSARVGKCKVEGT
ncbi:MAG: hypothetical protein CMI32_03745 [Opitutales bacterium]|nr:hypothetical protein [Opitutales bacterium]